MWPPSLQCPVPPVPLPPRGPPLPLLVPVPPLPVIPPGVPPPVSYLNRQPGASQGHPATSSASQGAPRAPTPPGAWATNELSAERIIRDTFIISTVNSALIEWKLICQIEDHELNNAIDDHEQRRRL